MLRFRYCSSFSPKFCSSSSFPASIARFISPLSFYSSSTNQTQIQPLRTVLNQFKRAGAHPDLISMIDAEKATQNGKMLMALEQALQDRMDETWRKQQAQKILQLDEEEAEREGVMKLKFWIRKHKKTAMHQPAKFSSSSSNTALVGDPSYQDPLESANELFPVECDFTPYRSDEIVQRQLESLFKEAGIMTPFEVRSISSSDVDSDRHQPKDLHSKLDQALYYRSEVMSDSAVTNLLTRANFATNVLRSRGVVLCIRDSNLTSYLVTMPEKPKTSLDVAATSVKFQPEYDQEQLAYVRDTGFQPFDLKSIATETAAETIVDKIETLAQWYLKMQGTTLRPGVCYLIENNDKKKDCSITSDGCISLPILAPHVWLDFLGGLTQPEWASLVKAQEQWRSHQPSLLRLRKSHLARIADMLYFHKIDLKAGVGSMNDKWVNQFVDGYLKEEVAIRKTMDKYSSDLKNQKLKQKGVIEIVNSTITNTSNETTTTNASQQKPKLCADGTFIIPSTFPPIQVMKFLKQEQKCAKAAKNIESFALAESHLEHIGHMCQLRIGIDKQWRKSTDKDIGVKLKQAVNTLRFSKDALTQFSRKGGRSHFTILICDEERYSTVTSMMSSVAMNKSGVIPMHWGIKATDLSRSLLSAY